MWAQKEVGDQIMITAIILASGYSKRMGQNKLLLKFKGKSLIENTIDTVLQCGFSEVILVAREEEIIEIGNRNRLKVIKNENAVKGISESIKLGVMQGKETGGYMFFTADQPFLSIDTIKALTAEFSENSEYIIVPRYEGKRGSPVIFPSDFKEDFLKLEGDVGGKVIINKNMEKVKFLEIEDSVEIVDIDTNENYENILKLERDDEHVK